MNKTNHPYHIVTFSPWPILLSINLILLLIRIIKIFYQYNIHLLIISLINTNIILFQWWRDVIREGTFQGIHTIIIIKNLKLGIILFIISEIFFFISLFWTYFHSSLSPSIEIGIIWPPKNINILNPYRIPLLNSIILISSGITITWSHHRLIIKNKIISILTLIQTIILSLIFTSCQIYEYFEISFTIADSIFGSIFFLTTGFHGLHVIIGTIFLITCLIRLFNNHFSRKHHFGYEAAIWYWHFVDIVWLFVYTWIYWWSF